MQDKYAVDLTRAIFGHCNIDMPDEAFEDLTLEQIAAWVDTVRRESS
jgi:hypothetical protein